MSEQQPEPISGETGSVGAGAGRFGHLRMRRTQPMATSPQAECARRFEAKVEAKSTPGSSPSRAKLEAPKVELEDRSSQA